MNEVTELLSFFECSQIAKRVVFFLFTLKSFAFVDII